MAHFHLSPRRSSISLRILTALIVQTLLTLSSALKLTFISPANVQQLSLPASTTATLTTSHKPPVTAHIQRSPSEGFTFRDITALTPARRPHPGTGRKADVSAEEPRVRESYLFQVHCLDYVFAPYRVDVVRESEPRVGGGKNKGQGTARVRVEVFRTYLGNAWTERGELKGRFVTGGGDDDAGDSSAAGPGAGEDELKVELELLGRKEYYVAREGFNPLSLLYNPMILLALVSLVLVFGMPYMLDNMDEETRKEFEDHQRQGPLAAITGFGAGGAGSSSSTGEGSGSRGNDGVGGTNGDAGDAGASVSAGMRNFDMAAWMAGHNPSSTSRGGSAGAAGGEPGRDGQGSAATGASSGGTKARRRG